MRSRLGGLFALAVGVVAAVLVGVAGPASSQALAPVNATERVSVDSSGGQVDGPNFDAAVSADGRFVAFTSEATNLVPGDINGVSDVFVHDRETGATERAGVSSSGGEGNGASSQPVISADGRFVAFASTGTNLVPGDTNGASDVFVHDRQTGATERVSVDSSSRQANKASLYPAISGDGRFVAFESRAGNLVPRDRNRQSDVFVHDRQTGSTELVSVGVDSPGIQKGPFAGSGRPAISVDGRFVSFPSAATNLVSGDTNGVLDVFVRDRQTAATERVSVSSSGIQGDAASYGFAPISADGRFVAFSSLAGNLALGDTKVQGSPDTFVRDRQVGTTERVSVDSSGNPGDGGSGPHSISADGRFVAFDSYSTNLVPDDTNGLDDVFVRDRQTSTTERVSVSVYGGQAVGSSIRGAISADGRFVAFESSAANLVPGDTNGWDIFVRRRHAPQIYSFTPASGITGSEVMIAGVHFDGATSVELNGKTAGFEVLSPHQVRMTVPNGATTGPITVTNPDGTAKSTSDYTVTFSITNLSPESGPVGTVVTLDGIGFSDVTNVKFHGVPASFTVLSPTSIRATVPIGATTGTVKATSPQGTVTGPKFTVTAT